jgi:molybdate transport system substrate-binding protein
MIENSQEKNTEYRIQNAEFSLVTSVSCLLSSVFCFCIFGLVVHSGCAKKESDKQHKELVVLCGSSFAQPMEQLCSEFTAETGIEIATTVAGSEDFLPLIRVGRKGDVLVTHDPYLDYVADANALADHAAVGFVAPVLAVQKGNPKGLTRIEDLAQPGLKVALTDPQYSTCGQMLFALLDKKGIKDAVMKNVENRLTKGHSTLGTFLKTQAVDAVIIWNGVAYTFRDSAEIVPTPYEYDNEIRVHIIGLSYSKQPKLVEQFIEFARSRGPEIFAQHGYTKDIENLKLKTKSSKLLNSSSQTKELLLYCAAGIRPPVDELVEVFRRDYRGRIAVDYAGSEMLLSTIRLARRGDLYMPGERYYIEQAKRENMILSHRAVCYWVATILVQKGNPKNIRALEDLFQGGLKLGLGDPNACAIGRVTQQILAKNDIAWEDIKERVAYQSLTVNELGMQIQARALDAVIVWDAIAQYYSQYGDQIPIAPAKNMISTVDIGVLTFTKQKELAEKFVDFATGESGRAIFEKYHYRTTAPR